MAANTMGITRFCKVYLELKSSLRPTRSLKTKFSMFSKSITELILIMFLMGGSLYIAYSYLGVEKLFNSYSDPGMLLELR